MTFQPVKPSRLFEDISRQIGDQIRSGQLQAGDKLPNERELAATFAVSRHAVREALRSLETIGQLEFKKGASGGAFVAKDNPLPFTKIMQGMFEVGGISLEQLTEARLAIEAAVIAVVGDRIDDLDLTSLEANVDAAERETIAGNLAKKTQLNVEFHTRLAELTGNPILIMMVKSLMSVLLDFIKAVGSVMGVDVIKSRSRFLKHLADRNIPGAIQEMERHLKILHLHYIRAAGNKFETTVKEQGNQ